MKLQAVVDSLDGVDAAIKPLYTQGEDKKFYLGVEGMVPNSRLEEFRTNNIALKKSLEAFEGVDPLRHKELVEQARKLKEKQLIEAGDVDKVVEERVKAMRTEFETTGATQQRTIDTLSGKLTSVLIDSTVKSAAVTAGAVPTAVDDVVLRAKSVFTIKDGNVVALNEKGETIYGKDGTTPLQIDEWVVNLKKGAPHLFLGMSGSGARGAGGGGLTGDTSKLSPTQKIAVGMNAAAGNG